MTQDSDAPLGDTGQPRPSRWHAAATPLSTTTLKHGPLPGGLRPKAFKSGLKDDRKLLLVPCSHHVHFKHFKKRRFSNLRADVFRFVAETEERSARAACESEVTTDEERNERGKQPTAKKTSQKTTEKPVSQLKIKKRHIKKEQPRRNTKANKRTENQERDPGFSPASFCRFSAGGLTAASRWAPARAEFCSRRFTRHPWEHPP